MQNSISVSHHLSQKICNYGTTLDMDRKDHRLFKTTDLSGFWVSQDPSPPFTTPLTPHPTQQHQKAVNDPARKKYSVLAMIEKMYDYLLELEDLERMVLIVPGQCWGC